MTTNNEDTKVAKICYYCGGDHEDNPCPKRKADADRFEKIGLEMYPRYKVKVGSISPDSKTIQWRGEELRFGELPYNISAADF